MKTKEEKIYELLGIKEFKKLVIFLQKKFRLLFKDKMKKGELYFDNYFLITNDLDGLKKFKKQGVIFNSLIHAPLIITGIIKLVICLLSSTITFWFLIKPILFILLNVYCVMLQRYNTIRINKTIKKIELKNRSKQTEEYQQIVKELDSFYKKNDKSKVELVETLKNTNQDNINISYLRILRDEIKNYQENKNEEEKTKCLIKVR